MRHQTWLHINGRARVCKLYKIIKKTSLSMRHRTWMHISEWRARVCKAYQIIIKKTSLSMRHKTWLHINGRARVCKATE